MKKVILNSDYIRLLGTFKDTRTDKIVIDPICNNETIQYFEEVVENQNG